MTIPVTILQQRTIPLTQADWASTVSFNQFDPSTGTLLDAVITTAGSVDGSASIENLGPSAATINLGVAANINATAVGIGSVAAMTPDAVASVNLGGFQGTFDGTLDFSGPSGTVLPHITASEVQQVVVTPGLAGPGTEASIAPLLGTGTFDVDVSAYATSTVEGNGNLAVLLHGSVGATLSLRYDAATQNGEGYGDSAAGDSQSGIGPYWNFSNFANSVTTTPQVVAFASETSGWTSSASFARFDPSLGTLDEILINVGNTDSGTFSAENLEAVPASVWMAETANLTVAIPGPAANVTATATNSDYLALGAFDGSADFAGTSGRSDIALASGASHDSSSSGAFDYWQAGSGDGDNNSGLQLSDRASLAAFTGTGTIALPVSDTGTSLVTGPSNLLEEITQQTGGSVSVSYIYTPLGGTREAAATSGNGGLLRGSVLSETGAWAATAPGLTFIEGGWVAARPNETFVIGAGANATISQFSLNGGDKLNLTELLDGASLAHDLSNLGLFLTVTGQSTDVLGGADTTLAVSGPGGAASLVLFNSGSIAPYTWASSGPISVLDLINNNALVLPPH